MYNSMNFNTLKFYCCNLYYLAVALFPRALTRCGGQYKLLGNVHVPVTCEYVTLHVRAPEKGDFAEVMKNLK